MPNVLRLSSREDGVLRYADVELDLNRLKVRRNGCFIPLSTMQMRVLRHFLENPEVVFSRKQLLKAVWGTDELKDGAVTACVMRIRAGLNAAGGPDLIRSIPSVGYALDIDAERPLPSPARKSQRVRGLTDSSQPRNSTVMSRS